MTSVKQTETDTPGRQAAHERHELVSQDLSSLIQTATMEFHASLHLLADRARFVTGAAGAAIALDEDGEFIYCASSGQDVPDCGAAADIAKTSLRTCIENRRATHNSSVIAVPVVRQQKVAAFFELAYADRKTQEDAEAGQGNADDHIEAVSHLAEMVNTALDHLEAAEHAENRACEPKLEPKLEPEPRRPTATPAKAPDLASQPLQSADPSPSDSVPATIHACKSCGFPVSPARAVCVDCEEHPERVTANPGEGLFQLEKQESWIERYGYTIASLLITALMVAIIFWLR